MTDQELEGLARQALNMAKTEMRIGHCWTGFLLASYHRGEGLHRMRSVEKLIREKLGDDWLDSGWAKDQAYGVMRLCVKLAPPPAIVMVNAINRFKPTKKLMAMGEEVFEDLFHHGHDRHHEAVKQGLLTLEDAVAAIAQTPEQVCLSVQLLGPRKIFIGQPDTRIFPQEGFDGRTKMYGEGEHCIDLDPAEVLAAMNRGVQ